MSNLAIAYSYLRKHIPKRRKIYKNVQYCGDIKTKEKEKNKRTKGLDKKTEKEFFSFGKYEQGCIVLTWPECLQLYQVPYRMNRIHPAWDLVRLKRRDGKKDKYVTIRELSLQTLCVKRDNLFFFGSLVNSSRICFLSIQIARRSSNCNHYAHLIVAYLANELRARDSSRAEFPFDSRNVSSMCFLVTEVKSAPKQQDAQAFSCAGQITTSSF